MPANVAVALNPALEYAWVECEGEVLFMAKDLLAQVGAVCHKDLSNILGTTLGKDMEFAECVHPFPEYNNRRSLVVMADYVTTEAGTGCVHTAPGHGDVDFETGLKYKLPILCPVDSQGKLTEEAGERFKGMFVFDANIPVLKYLAELNCLLGKENIKHQYAHCWRCKNPIIFRATSQWFASIDGFRDEALKSIDDVQWIPSWGQQRIHNMVSDRHDWCISRQRVWGVPIPVFYCDNCGEHLINEATIDSVANWFEKEGSDAWWAHTAEELLPEGTVCPKCGGKHFHKESDIMDVWFDSGSSHMAVAAKRPELSWPVAMYLEGSDQHRGWFQSSLLTSVAVAGRAPYESVLTHGYVVDGDGRKMSKSVGNVIVPQDVIKQYGADIIRLWTASSDYKADIRISPKILKQLAEVYRKIRNTIRYILGNTNDFNYETDAVPFNEMLELDQWALMHLQLLKKEVTAAYESYDFHVLYHAIHNFCTVEMSSFYLDILKDRLYCESRNGLKRRSAQTALYLIVDAMARMFAPILPFTCDEIWQAMPHRAGDDVRNVVLNEMVQPYEAYALDAEAMARWDTLIALRSDVNGVLEQARADKRIGKALEAHVALCARDEAAAKALETVKDMDLTALLLVSDVILTDDDPDAANVTGSGTAFPGLRIEVRNAEGVKCPRCWMHSTKANADGLCPRCAAVMAELDLGE